jgi:hypothetical protein
MIRSIKLVRQLLGAISEFDKAMTVARLVGLLRFSPVRRRPLNERNALPKMTGREWSTTKTARCANERGQ